MKRQTRVEVLERLVRLFDELKQEPTASKQAGVSPQLKGLARGDLTLEEYLSARIDACLEPMVELLDEEDIAYLKYRCREYLETEVLPSQQFSAIRRSLAGGQVHES